MSSYRTRRSGVGRGVLALVLLALVTAACGTRIDQTRIEAASYLDGTEVETVTNPSAGEPGAPTGAGSTVGADGGAGPAAGGGVVSSGGEGSGSGGGAAEAAAGATGGGQVVDGARIGVKATGSEVSIGVLGTFSGPVGVYVKDFATAVQVWGRWANDNGGLNGHRVRVIVGEDGGSPAGFNSRAQQMVEEEGVLAFAFTTLGLAPQGNNAYLSGAKVPTFGTESGTNVPYQDPYVLTAVPSGDLYADAMLRGFAGVMRSRGLTKFASLACSDFSLCDNFDRRWTDATQLDQIGMQVVYRGRPSLTTPDFTSICIDARNAGAEGILNGLDTASLNRLADSCARQGYHPVIGLADLLARPEIAQNANADAGVVGTKQVPWFDTRVPGIKEFHDAFAKYAPGVSLNGTLAGGWFAARFLQAAAANLPEEPTSADFIEGLADLGGTTLGGVTYPISYTPGQPSPRKLCYSAAVIREKRFVSAPGDPLKCA